MNMKQRLIYTSIGFIVLCLLSYLVNGQTVKLSMKDALSLAITHNREIAIAKLDIDKSEQEIKKARSLQLPVASANAQLAHYFKEPAFFGFGNANTSDDKIPYGRFGGKDQGALSIAITQPLYNPAARPAKIYANLLNEESRILLSGKETDIAALLKQTYIQLLVLTERIKLQKESVNRNRKALEDAKSLLAQGRALRVDTLRAYTSVKNLEPDLLRLTYAIEVGKQQLKTIIGIDSLNEIELSDSLYVDNNLSVLTEEEVFSRASENRADIKALTLQPELDEQQTKIAASAMKPTVAVTGQYLVQTQATQFNYFNSFYPSTPFVGAQLTVPIFNGFLNKAKVKSSQIQKHQSEIKLTNAKEQLKAEVKHVVANVRETSSRIQTSLNVKETAQLSYDITQYRYGRGVASRLELTDAELALTTAQSNYLEAVYDYLSAHIALNRTIGITGD